MLGFSGLTAMAAPSPGTCVRLITLIMPLALDEGLGLCYTFQHLAPVSGVWRVHLGSVVPGEKGAQGPHRESGGRKPNAGLQCIENFPP